MNGLIRWTDSSKNLKYKWTINIQKLFNIASHKKNAHQNYIEIQSHQVRMAVIKKITNVVEKCGQKEAMVNTAAGGDVN